MLNETETQAGHTFTPRQLRMLKISIVVMGVLLVLGFGLLLIGIYMQAGKLAKPAADAPLAPAQTAQGGTLLLPVEPGAELRSVQADGGRLILHLYKNGGGEIAVIDIATGREIQRIALTPRR